MNTSFEEYRKRVAQGESIGHMLVSLRADDLTAIEALKTIKELYRLKIGDALQYLTDHPSWADEAKQVFSMENIFGKTLANPSSFAWAEWYDSGIHTGEMGRFISSRGEEWEREIEARLREAAQADEETQQHLIHNLASEPDEICYALIAIISKYRTSEKSVLKLALRAMRMIGYPRNAAAISWLVNLATAPDASGREEAIPVLKEIDGDALIPYFLAAFVNNGNDSPRWSKVVNGVCRIVIEKKEWAIACGPAVANLLAQQVNKRGDMPDAAALFSVLQYIGPDCNYAIPAIFSLALRQKDSELGQKAHGFLLAFDGDALRPYRYHLQWLPEL